MNYSFNLFTEINLCRKIYIFAAGETFNGELCYFRKINKLWVF